MKTEKIALFGGSFDPVHRAHLAIAVEAVKECSLDRVLFIPCPQSPHKDDAPGASAADRLAMLRLATRNLPWADVTSWELDRTGDSPAYSWMTATHFSEACPDAELFWIAGSDQWNRIESWSRPDILASLLTFVVFPRGEPPVSHPGFRSVSVDFSMDGSSTEVRGRLFRGEPIGDLVPDAVAEYIGEHGIYRPDRIDKPL